jgi:hypothetical protein
MKRLWIIACLFAILPISAFAAKTKSKDLKLDQSVQVAGKQLKPGNYKLKWEQNGNNTANVAIYNDNNKEVATAPAQIVHANNPNNASYEINTKGGENKLDRVYISHQALKFGSAATAPGM